MGILFLLEFIVKKLKFLVISLFTLAFVYGCSDSGLGNVKTVVSGLLLPAKVEVIPDDAAVSGNLAAVNYAAFNDAGTDYAKLETEYWINAGQWQEPLNMADMLVCIMGASSHADLANATYQGLIDMGICNSDSGDQAAAKANFAEVVMTTSRASNTAKQIGDAYFTSCEDENGDGDTSDANECQEFASNIEITEGASTSNPFGEFTMSWNQDNAPAGDHSRGTLKFTKVSDTVAGISFIEENKETGAYDFNQWAAGELNKDGSGGKVKVKAVDNGSTMTYKINFNGTHANIIQNTDAAVCSSLDESTMTTYVDRYNLYDSSGALVDISAGLEFVHTASKDKRGYAGSYFDNNGNEKFWMWVDDGSAPTTIYSESNPDISYSVTWSSGQPTISGLSFDAPIRFTASFTGVTPGGVSGTKTDDLNYEGPGQLWGIDWSLNGDTNSNGNCDGGESSCTGNWSPAYNLADGLELTGTNGAYSGVKYYVKRVQAWKTLATVASSNCSSIPVTDSDVSFTTPTLTAVTNTFADKPTITGKPRVIHGIKQY